MAPGQAGSGWTTGRIIALAAGSVLLVISLALVAGGGTLVWADQEQVHAGYVTTSSATYSTRGFAPSGRRGDIGPGTVVAGR